MSGMLVLALADLSAISGVWRAPALAVALLLPLWVAVAGDQRLRHDRRGARSDTTGGPARDR